MITLNTASESGEPSAATRIRSTCSFMGHLCTPEEQPACQRGGARSGPVRRGEFRISTEIPGESGRGFLAPRVASDLRWAGCLEKGNPMVKKILTALDGSK